MKTMAIDCFNNSGRIVARINTDRPLGFVAANDASMLLESGDSNGFDDHKWSMVSGWSTGMMTADVDLSGLLRPTEHRP
jgi:hypothetical protein